MWEIEKHCRALEFDKVCRMLADNAGSDDAKSRALALIPKTTLVQVQGEMNRTEDAHSLAARYGYPYILKLKNCEDALKRAYAGASITPRDLLDIARILQSSRTLSDWRSRCEEDHTTLDSIFHDLLPNRTVEDKITSTILSEEEISDNASPTLSDIRRKIRISEQRVRSQLDGLIHSTAYQKYLQEPIVTIRDGRFVVPVKAEYRGEVKGLVHASSASGSTLFIEPISVVEANNEIKVLESKEEIEIERIILELSSEVGSYKDNLLQSYDAVIDLDLYFAKAMLADQMNSTAPEITDDGIVILKNARHPLIDKNKVVPTNISLGETFDTLVITGPNTGGKTVVLKTLGLFTLMAMSGLMIPAGFGSRVSVFSQVLADIGDEQSIEQSLSTFSAHMTKIIRILQDTDEHTLVLLDELGAGTDPVEGAALAVSIIQKLRSRSAKIAATTHYPEIKMYALQTEGVENACCEFDVQTLQPTFRLLIGVPGRSNAFAISERLGMDPDVVESARALISGEDARFEDVVSELERSRQELEREKQEANIHTIQAANLRKELQEEKVRIDVMREREMEKARMDAQKMLGDIQEEAKKMMDELEELKKQKDSEAFSQMAADARISYRTSMKKLERLADPVFKRTGQINYTPEREIRRGDSVILPGVKKSGVVLTNPDQNGYVTVQAGVMKTKVRTSELRLAGQPDKKTTVNSRTVSNIRANVGRTTRDVRTEVDVRGKTVQEALLDVDQFIDNAVLLGLNIATIIHGKGTGTLRAAVHEHLRGHRNVRSFRLGVYGEGENGVTIVELK